MKTYNYPEYAAIQKHINAHRIERAPAIAEFIARVLTGAWKAIQEPPAPAPIIIDRRRESRTGGHRRLATR